MLYLVRQTRAPCCLSVGCSAPLTAHQISRHTLRILTNYCRWLNVSFQRVHRTYDARHQARDTAQCSTNQRPAAAAAAAAAAEDDNNCDASPWQQHCAVVHLWYVVCLTAGVCTRSLLIRPIVCIFSSTSCIITLLSFPQSTLCPEKVPLQLLSITTLNRNRL